MHWLQPAFGLVLLGVVIWIAQAQLRHLTAHGVEAAIERIAPEALLAAVGVTALGYLIMCGYDLLGMRYIRGNIPPGRTAFASFLSMVFSNNVGLSVIGATAVRLRLYTAWGLGVADVLKLVAFTSVSFWLGIFTVAGLAFVVSPIHLPTEIPLPDGAIRPIGVAMLTLVVTYLGLCAVVRGHVMLRKTVIELPRWRLALMQPVIGTADWVLAGLTLYLLLPQAASGGGSAPPFLAFLTMYILAQLAGQISHVPGGLGVMDTLMIVMLKPWYSEDAALATLLMFRGVFLLLPLAVAALMMGGYEVGSWVHRRRVYNADRFEQRVNAKSPRGQDAKKDSESIDGQDEND